MPGVDFYLMPNMTTPRRGYTLLEMTVAIGLFSVVMLLATGAFLKFISLDRKARSLNDVSNNLAFAVDTMSRSIRTGSSYRCGGVGQGPNCWGTGAGKSTFSFTDDQGRTVTYLLKTDGSIGRCALTSGSCTATNAVSLTDPRITIQGMTFYTRGVGTTTGSGNEYIQPYVLFSVHGYLRPDSSAATVDFTIETQADQRLIEL